MVIAERRIKYYQCFWEFFYNTFTNTLTEDNRETLIASRQLVKGRGKLGGN